MDHCQICGKCCENLCIYIFGRDLREIITYYPDYHPQEFAEIINSLSFDQYKKEIEEGFPFIEISENNITYQGYLIIKKINTNGKLRCIFQDPSSRLCKIHDHKPIACRIYPHQLQGFTATQWMNNALCPEPWIPEPKEQKKSARLILEFAMQTENYFHEITIWNEQEKNHSINSFWKFIIHPRPYDSFQI